MSEMKITALAVLFSWVTGTAGTVAYLHANFQSVREAEKIENQIYDKLKRIEDKLDRLIESQALSRVSKS